jgi:hypothetical protein
MRPRHWDSLSTELALDLHPDKSYTLDKALKQGLLGHLEVLSKTADVASKEYSIEQVGLVDAAAIDYSIQLQILQGALTR